MLSAFEPALHVHHARGTSKMFDCQPADTWGKAKTWRIADSDFDAQCRSSLEPKWIQATGTRRCGFSPDKETSCELRKQRYLRGSWWHATQCSCQHGDDTIGLHNVSPRAKPVKPWGHHISQRNVLALRLWTGLCVALLGGETRTRERPPKRKRKLKGE